MDNLPKEKGENIKCYVRCRPLNEHEKGIGCINLDKEHNMISVENRTDSNTNLQGSINGNPRLENKNFSLDWVADESVTQELFYNQVATPILKSFFQGYNCTIFAYGQTGAGKSYTMLGSMDSIFDFNSLSHGLIPRIINSIFDKNKNKTFIINPDDDIDNFRDMKFEIKCSCLEIYQEQIIDLLNSSNNPHKESENLVIREDAKRGMYIEGIREEIIVNQRNALELIMLGLKNRHQAATFMNAESSRSHLIFTIFLTYSFSNKEGLITTRSSRLHLIDLAGSERQKATRAVGERIKEAGMINKSLSTLGNVINALVEFSEGKTKYIPFRDSKLTFFLKDSLGGNSKTTIIANISQSIIQIQETLSTLKFVQRAKLIKNKATINENINATMKILQEEIKKLKDELELSKKSQLQLQNNINVLTTTQSNNNGSTNNPLLKRNSTNNTNICDFCSLKKNKQDQELTPVDIRREKILSDQTNQIKLLLSKIDHLIELHPEIERKLKNLDDIYLEEFFEKKFIYEKNSQNILLNLNEKFNHLSNILNMSEGLFCDLKESIKRSNKNIDFDKINKIFDELNNFKYDFELNSYLDVYKLENENRSLKNELEVYQNISEILQKNKLYSKVTHESLSYYNNSIKEFIDVNKEIKEFFKQNIISKNGDKTLKDINLAFIDNMTLEKMKFQIEELKIQENNILKQVEELESENFLLNMEITKYKSENEFAIESKINPNVDDNINQNFNSLNNNKIDDSEFIDFKNVYKSDSTNNDANEENKNNVQNINNNEIITNFNNNVKINNLNINLNINNGNNFNGNVNENESFKNKMPFNNDKFNTPNKNSNNKDLTENLINSYSNQNSNRNSTLDHLNSPTGNLNNNTHRTLTKENLELLRLKEKLDNILVDLDEKESSINDKNLKIQELEATIENLEKNISINTITIKSLKDELDTLYDSNNILTMDLEKVNEHQEIMKKTFDSEVPQIYDLIDTNIQSMDKLTEEYKNDMNSLSQMYGKFSTISNQIIMKLSNSLKESSEKLESSEKEKNSLFKFYKESIINIFQNMTLSVQEFEKNVNTKLNQLEIKFGSTEDFIHKAQVLVDNKIKKQNSIFQGEIHRRILNILTKVGILSGREDFDALLDKFEQHITGKIFNYLNIDKNKLTKLERKILELKDEKRQLNNDIILLRTDFSDALSSMALNNKIALLMKFKEENFKLRIEINQMRKRNDGLEKQMQKIFENNKLNSNLQTNFSSILHANSLNNTFSNLNNSKLYVQSENNVNTLLHLNSLNSNNNVKNIFNNNMNNTSLISNQGCFVNQISITENLEEFSKIKSEYNELIEKIFELDDNENTKNFYKNKNGQNKEKQVFRKALEILNKINENKEYDKFFNKISFKNEIDNKNNIFDTISNAHLQSDFNINNQYKTLNLTQNHLNISTELNIKDQPNIDNNNNKKFVSSNLVSKSPAALLRDDLRNKTPTKKKEEKSNSTLIGFNKTPKNSIANPNNPTINNRPNKSFLLDKRDSIKNNNNKLLKSQNDILKKNSLK